MSIIAGKISIMLIPNISSIMIIPARNMSIVAGHNLLGSDIEYIRSSSNLGLEAN